MAKPTLDEVNSKMRGDGLSQNPTRARETVTVYFKEHIPFLELQLERAQEVVEQGQTGPRSATRYFKYGPVIRVRGLSYPVGQVPDGFGDKPTVVAGFAVTHNIDKEWWDEWFKTHQDYPPVRNGHLFAHADRASGVAIAKEHAGKPQFSPIDPKNPADGRVLKSANPDMTGIKSDDSRSPVPMR